LIKQIRALVHRLWSIQLLRFLVVGGLNTVFGYTIYSVFILLHLHYVLAALLGQICGILFNFKTTGTIVFKNKDNRLIFRFFAVYLVTYLITIGLLKIFDNYNIGSLVAGAIIILPIAFLSFFLNKKFVFNKLQKKKVNQEDKGESCLKKSMRHLL
jgi:putative flippase GtrA